MVAVPSDHLTARIRLTSSSLGSVHPSLSDRQGLTIIIIISFIGLLELDSSNCQSSV